MTKKEAIEWLESCKDKSEESSIFASDTKIAILTAEGKKEFTIPDIELEIELETDRGKQFQRIIQNHLDEQKRRSHE